MLMAVDQRWPKGNTALVMPPDTLDCVEDGHDRCYSARSNIDEALAIDIQAA